MAAEHPKRPANAFAALPYDLLHAIVAHIPDARSLASLNQTCKTLNKFISTSEHGWQIFVQSQFPSIYPSIFPHGASTDAAHKINWRRHADELTLLSRNYDQRGFLAQIMDPEVFTPPSMTVTQQQPRRMRGRGGASFMPHYSIVPVKSRQTVGFRPVLDAYSYLSGVEVVALGAGQDILLRRRARAAFTGEPHEQMWWLYQEETRLAGRDDITALKLFKDGQGRDGTVSKGSERVLVGRASGELSCVKLRTPQRCSSGVSSARVETVLDTGGRKVRFASLLQHGEDALVASVLGNDVVALHKMPAAPSQDCRKATVHIPTAGELTFLSVDEQPWTTQFLGPNMLAVGKSSEDPLSLYSITPTGVASTPIRTFSAESCVDSKTSSVQPIAPLPDIRCTPDLFITGWHTGVVLVHDLRSPDPFVASYIDPLDSTSSVFSLLALGRERILVGGARHNIMKVFDLRMPGGRVYFAPVTHVPKPPRNPPPEEPATPATPATSAPPGWATYLSQRSVVNTFTHRNQRQRWEKESGVYSLVSGSPGGARVLGGIEGAVWEFDFLGEVSGQRNVRYCNMYEFMGRTRLWRQGDEDRLGRRGPAGASGVLDGRWG